MSSTSKKLTIEDVPWVPKSQHKDGRTLIKNPLTEKWVLPQGESGQVALNYYKKHDPKEAVDGNENDGENKTKNKAKKKTKNDGDKKTKNEAEHGVTKKIEDSNVKIANLVSKQREAMVSKNIALWKTLSKQIDEEKQKREILIKQDDLIEKDYKFLNICKVNGKLPKIPTIEGEQEMADLIKNENQLIVYDNMCYDIVSLIELIKVDISQGNVFGLNPYVKSEGLAMPFPIGFKESLLAKAKKNKLIQSTTQWENRSPLSSDNIELRGKCVVSYMNTPNKWLSPGWGSDKSQFPTKSLICVSFIYPNLPDTVSQQPGYHTFFPDTKESEDFIDMQLIPTFLNGALWSQKMSVTTGAMVMNPNVHLMFFENQPERWYAKKQQSLEEEMSKFSPGFLQKKDNHDSSVVVFNNRKSICPLFICPKEPDMELVSNYLKINPISSQNIIQLATCRQKYVGVTSNSAALNNAIIEYLLTGIPIEKININVNIYTNIDIVSRCIYLFDSYLTYIKKQPYKKPVTVYHGSALQIHNSDKKISCMTFLSTTLSKNVALFYAGKKGYVYEITIPPSYPFMNFFDTLLQILLPARTEMNIHDEKMIGSATIYKCSITVDNIFAKIRELKDLFESMRKLQQTVVKKGKGVFIQSMRLVDLVETGDPYGIYKEPNDDIALNDLKFVRPKFFIASSHSSSMFVRPIITDDIVDTSNITTLFLMSRAVNEVLTNLIYDFYEIDTVACKIVHDPKMPKHLSILLMSRGTKKAKKEQLESFDFNKSFFVDCITWNTQSHLSQNVVDTKNKNKPLMRIQRGNCLAFNGKFKRVNIPFFTTSDCHAATQQIYSNSSPITTNERNRCLKVVSNKNISTLSEFPSIVQLCNDMETYGIASFIVPFVDIIIKNVQSRHAFILKNIDELYTAMDMVDRQRPSQPKAGGKGSGSSSKEKNYKETAQLNEGNQIDNESQHFIPSNFLNKLIATRISESASASASASAKKQK